MEGKKLGLLLLCFLTCFEALAICLCEDPADHRQVDRNQQLNDEISHVSVRLGNVQRHDEMVNQVKRAKGVYSGGELIKPKSSKNGAAAKLIKSASMALGHTILVLHLHLFFF